MLLWLIYEFIKEPKSPKDMVDGVDSNKVREIEKNCRQARMERDEAQKVTRSLKRAVSRAAFFELILYIL